MKSRMRWEYADIFRAISNWHASLKGDEVEIQPIEIEMQMTNDETIEDIPVSESLMENILSDYDQENTDTVVHDHFTWSSITMDDPSTPTYPGNVQRNVSLNSSSGSSISDSSTEQPTGDDNSVVGAFRVDVDGSPHEQLHGMMDLEYLSDTNENMGSTNQKPVTEPKLESSLKHSGYHSTKNKPFKCDDCEKTFLNRDHLTAHLRTHSGEKPYKCKECPKMFSQKGNLTIHQRIHSAEKPYKCTECPKMFTQRVSLMAHQRRHSGEKPFECPDCPKKFSDSSTLKSHMFTHSGNKPYKCTECPKMFSQSGHLTRHQRTHSGEKPFKCPHCSKAFAQSCNMKTHIFTQHTESKEDEEENLV